MELPIDEVGDCKGDDRKKADRLDHERQAEESVEPSAVGGHDDRIMVGGQRVRAWLSSYSFKGESGISVNGTPSASSIAAASTAPTGITPASPAPLIPSGFSGDGVSMWSISIAGISVAYGIRNSMNDALRSCPSA